MEEYNVVWNTQSKNSSESMPLGGHNAGCNVWTENNELCIYLSQSGSFDENGTMLKLGRIRLWLEDKNSLSVNFKQELELNKGQINISSGLKNGKLNFLLWMDVSNANLHILFHSDSAKILNLSLIAGDTVTGWWYRMREANAGT